MKRIPLGHLSLTTALVAAAFIPASCSARSTAYDRLCRIYEEFDARPDSSELAVAISREVEAKLLEIYADYHVVMTAGAQERYEMFRMLAREREHQENWSCEAIRNRYPPGTQK